MAAMRKAARIVVILLGSIVLAIYGIVMLRLSILAFQLSRFGIRLYVDPVETSIWACCVPCKRMKVRQLPTIALCCLSGISPTRTAAQQQDIPTQNGTYTFKSNVNEVLVPVVVRDKRGRVVGGLKKENFQVFDNGKPQVIPDS
jgi:hypothetical protein